MSTLKVNKIRDTSGSTDAITFDPSGGAVLAGVTTISTARITTGITTSIQVGGGVTISESGIEASGIGITCASINGTQIGGRKNIVINGAMNVAERGTSSSSSGNTQQTVDRFYVDVGGGSTEIYMRKSSKELYESFDLGAVRIMKGKDSIKEWEKLKAFLGVVKENNADALVGIGGNIRRIFKILGLQKYSPLELKKFEEIRNNLSNMPIIERINQYGLAEDRADVIVPASDIFSYILEHSNIKKLFAIDWGICDALAYEYLNNKLR